MQKSYLAITTINFVDFNFYVRPGDLLVHDLGNHNRLTVYRNGQIVKVVKQEPIGILAFLKNKFIQDVVNVTAEVTAEPKVVVATPTPTPTPTPVAEVAVAPVAIPEPQKSYSKKDRRERELTEDSVETEN